MGNYLSSSRSPVSRVHVSFCLDDLPPPRGGAGRVSGLRKQVLERMRSSLRRRGEREGDGSLEHHVQEARELVAGATAPIVLAVVDGPSALDDYLNVPARAILSGAEEVWVFDPELLGPKQTGGPFRLQLWRRVDLDDKPGEIEVRRVFAGAGPALSEVLSAWISVSTDGQQLNISNDRRCDSLWPPISRISVPPSAGAHH